MSYGPDAVHQLIQEAGWTYPVSVTRLEREYSLANITMNEKGESIMVVELLSEVDVDTFHDRSELEAVLEPVIEEKTQERKSGIIERIKRLF